METDCRLDVSHVELEARLDDLVVLEAGVREALPRAEAQAVEREPLDALGHPSSPVASAPPSIVVMFFVT